MSAYEDLFTKVKLLKKKEIASSSLSSSLTKKKGKFHCSNVNGSRINSRKFGNVSLKIGHLAE